MSKNPFRLPRHFDSYRRIVKIYGYEFASSLTYLEMEQVWVATANDKGFTYTKKNAKGKDESKTDYPFLTKAVY